jgi:hypothetical protein
VLGVTGNAAFSGNATFSGGSTSIANLNITSSGTYGGVALVYNSGTWTISVTGSAGSVPWSGVTSKPYAFNQSTDVGSSPVFATLETTGGVTSSGNGCWVEESDVRTTPSVWAVPIGIIASGAGMNAAGFYASSDARIKDRIADISADSAIGWVKAGRPRHYWKEGHPEAGFIAQEEIQNGRGESIIHVPDDRATFAEGDGYAEPGHRLSKNYEHEIAYLTRALQDALTRIEVLEKRPQESV